MLQLMKIRDIHYHNWENDDVVAPKGRKGSSTLCMD